MIDLKVNRPSTKRLQKEKIPENVVVDRSFLLPGERTKNENAMIFRSCCFAEQFDLSVKVDVLTLINDRPI